MTVAYLGLGSNLGDREGTLLRAIEALRVIPEVESVVLSSIFETAPVGGPAQGDFCNAVVRCETSLTPQALLMEMQRIESELGRTREVVNGPRTIDLDLLMYGQLHLSEPNLELPHPRMQDRRFVIEPLADLQPDLLLACGSTAAERLAHLKHHEHGTTA
jgi:2-amino-4-hydroxy-6-hydroxymethyldihydropteridine diphosphokinase